jgi:hypothetical protein
MISDASSNLIGKSFDILIKIQASIHEVYVVGRYFLLLYY